MARGHTLLSPSVVAPELWRCGRRAFASGGSPTGRWRRFCRLLGTAGRPAGADERAAGAEGQDVGNLEGLLARRLKGRRSSCTDQPIFLWECDF